MIAGTEWVSVVLSTLSRVVGVRKYGSDFAAIAEVIGNKMPSHVRNFFISYRQRFCLDDICRGEEHIHLSSTRNTKITKRDNAQPAAVRALFYISCNVLLNYALRRLCLLPLHGWTELALPTRESFSVVHEHHATCTFIMLQIEVKVNHCFLHFIL